ncbi:hypothetical protein [Amycolatopsis minnesotensis]|uniref:Uncharacterized protein n=1 Tax=Amycolatopsis minnesotensis TaxID=337894 RepID=A0ABN2SAW8_9PSEU
MLWLAGVLFLAIRHKAKKWKKVGWIFNIVLMALAVWALMLAPLPFGWGTIGGVLAWVVKWGLGFLGSWANVAAGPIAAVAMVIVIWFGAHDVIKDKKPDAWAKIAVYSLPVLALLAGGSIADKILHFTDMVGHLGPKVVASITG